MSSCGSCGDAQCCCSSAQVLSSAPNIHLEQDKRVGGHVGIYEKSLLKTLKVFQSMRTMQVMLGNPQRLDITTRFSNNELEKVREYMETTGVNFHVHAAYGANMAKKERIGVSVQHLNDIFDSLKDVPTSIVYHTGKRDPKVSRGAAYDLLADSIGQLYLQGNRTLLLENAAGQGNDIGVTTDEFRQIFERIDSTPHLGICFDTQHGFAAGVCPFHDHSCVVNTFEEIESIAPIGLIHLNDSKKVFGGKVDRHECLCKGHIWKTSDESLKTVLQWGIDETKDIILETHDIRGDLTMLRSTYLGMERE